MPGRIIEGHIRVRIACRRVGPSSGLVGVQVFFLELCDEVEASRFLCLDVATAVPVRGDVLISAVKDCFLWPRAERAAAGHAAAAPSCGVARCDAVGNHPRFPPS